LATYIVGYVISFLINIIKGHDIHNLEPNLFIPPIARKLEKMVDIPLNMKQWSESEEDVRSKCISNGKY
jgi:fructose-specific phosphotransferase system IIC component